MRSLKEWSYRDMEIQVKEHEGKAWLACVTLKEAQQLINAIGKSKLDFRRGKFYNGVALIDVYLKGYTYC